MESKIINVDLHVHTYYSPDAVTPIDKLITRCTQVGLDCIAITDHSSIQGALVAKEKAPFHVIIGEEIKTTGGDIIGLFLSELVPPGLQPSEAAERVKEQGGLVSIPHPFDTVRRSVLKSEALEEVLPYADLLEVFNARNTFAKADEQAGMLAKERGIMGCAVSDAHTPGELGRTYVRAPAFDGTPQGFMDAFQHGILICKRSSPLVHFASTYSKLYRRLTGGSRC